MEEKPKYKQNSNERLDLKNDYIFKRIFGKPENNQELKELLEAILGIPIFNLVIRNPEISKKHKKEKNGVLDILVIVNNDIMVDIEMQMSNVYLIVKRNVVYVAKMITEDTEIGDEYNNLKKYISINLLNENLFRGKKYHTVAHLKKELLQGHPCIDMNDKVGSDLLTDRVEFHYIELRKFLKHQPGMESKLEQWLWLFAGEEDKIEMIRKKNKTISKVVEDLDRMSADQVERLEAFKRKLDVWSYNMAMKESREAGEREGKKEEKIVIARGLKKKGINTDIIVETTGLSKKVIESL